MSDDKSMRVELDAHPRRDALARLVRTVAMSAADERRQRFSDGLDEVLRDAELEPEDGVVGSFNVLRALSQSEPPAAPGGEVLGRLLLRGIWLQQNTEDGGTDDVDWRRVAESLCWLSVHTHLSAVPFVDDELGDAAPLLWEELRGVVASTDAEGASRGRGESMVAAVALRASVSAAARSATQRLRDDVRDPLIAACLVAEGPAIDGAAGPTPAPVPATALQGEIVPTPLGPVGLVLWTVTGLILVRYVLRFITHVLLRFRRPVEISVGANGVTLKSKLDVLGRTIRSEEVHIPVGNLARAAREVRYPRLALYAGLFALSVGTYVGVSLASDGARAGSPSLLGLGAIVFGVGVAIDLVFSSLVPSQLGKHSMIFVPRRGRTYAVRVVDESAADRALKSLASS